MAAEKMGKRAETEAEAARAEYEASRIAEEQPKDNLVPCARIDSARAKHTRAQLAATKANVAALEAQLRATETSSLAAEAQEQLCHAMKETIEAIDEHQLHNSSQIARRANRLPNKLDSSAGSAAVPEGISALCEVSEVIEPIRREHWAVHAIHIGGGTADPRRRGASAVPSAGAMQSWVAQRAQCARVSGR